MHRVSFIEPASIVEVTAALATPEATVIAGGSDLLDQLKEGTAAYTRLVSLGALEWLRGIEAYEGGLRIGALTTVWELETSADLKGPYAMLAEAARGVATPELRNQGTLGGNLCQRPRCYFYRNALTPCRKKGDADACPAAESPYQNYLSIFGGGRPPLPNPSPPAERGLGRPQAEGGLACPPAEGGLAFGATGVCYATHASDLAQPLIALDARIVVAGADGGREVAAAAFFSGPEVDVRRETVLAPGEVVTHVILPPAPAGWRGHYSKARERTAGDFALASAAIGFAPADGRMTGVRVVLGGVAPTPLRSVAAEAVLEGQAPSEEVALRAAEAALAGARPLAHNGFKAELTRALILRGVMRLAGG
jgi:xanthine dehydrogenase YagS FAD-binding subunit